LIINSPSYRDISSSNASLNSLTNWIQASVKEKKSVAWLDFWQ
jgi:hypothetical protein